MLIKWFKKAFTLVEMLIVIVIIWILMAALLPKLTSAQDKAKDKKSLTSVKDYLIAQQAWNSSYPIHGENFSQKPYLIDRWVNWTNIWSLITANLKTKITEWGKGSWVYIYNPTDANVDWTDSNKFLTQILAKLSSKDMSQLPWNSNSVVSLWFFWNLGKILDKYKNDPGVTDLIKTLKFKWFTYIKNITATNPAKAVWGGFVLWLDKTPWNGGVKISDSSLISKNPELKDAYVNFAWVSDWIYFMSDLITAEAEKKWLVTSMLKTVDSQVWITDLTSGN